MEQLPSSLRNKLSPSLQASHDSIISFSREVPQNYLLCQNSKQKYEKLTQSIYSNLSQPNSNSQNISLEDLIEFRASLMTELEFLQKTRLIKDYIEELNGLISNNEQRVTQLEVLKEQLKLKNEEVKRINFSIQDLKSQRAFCINLLTQKLHEQQQLDEERTRIRAESPIFKSEKDEYEQSRNSSHEENKFLSDPEERKIHIKNDVSLSLLIQYNKGSLIFEMRKDFKHLIKNFLSQIRPLQLFLCTFNDGIQYNKKEDDLSLLSNPFGQMEETRGCFNWFFGTDTSVAKYDTSLKDFVSKSPDAKQFRQQILIIITCINGKAFTSNDLKKSIGTLKKKSPKLQVFFLDFGSDSAQVLREYSKIANPKNELAIECPSLTYFDISSSIQDAEEQLSRISKYVCDKNQFSKIPKTDFERQIQIEMVQQQKNLVKSLARQEKNFQQKQKQRIKISSNFLKDQNRSLHEDQLKRIENQASQVQEKINSCLEEEKDLNIRISFEEINFSKCNMLLSNYENQISELSNSMNEGEVLQLIQHVQNVRVYLEQIESYQKKVERELNRVKKLQENYEKGNKILV